MLWPLPRNDSDLYLGPPNSQGPSNGRMLFRALWNVSHKVGTKLELYVIQIGDACR